MFLGQESDQHGLAEAPEDVLVVRHLSHHHHHVCDPVLDLCPCQQILVILVTTWQHRHTLETEEKLFHFCNRTVYSLYIFHNIL